MNAERISKLLPGQDWQAVHQVAATNGPRMTTEVMELPHGCLVRSTTQHTGWGGRRVAASTMVFVPGLRLEKHGESFKLTYKP